MKLHKLSGQWIAKTIDQGKDGKRLLRTIGYYKTKSEALLALK